MTAQPQLEVGIELTREWTVIDSYLYNPTDTPGREVLSSPSMILEMESACDALVKPHLAEGTTTVGFHVDIKHVAPARPGDLMTTTARLIEIRGDRLTFEVNTKEGDRLVGTGRHRRAIIEV